MNKQTEKFLLTKILGNYEPGLLDSLESYLTKAMAEIYERFEWVQWNVDENRGMLKAYKSMFEEIQEAKKQRYKQEDEE